MNELAVAVVSALSSLAAMVVGAWAIETRLAALWRAEQRRAAARHRREPDPAPRPVWPLKDAPTVRLPRVR